MATVKFSLDFNGSFHQFTADEKYTIDHDKSFEEIKKQYKKIIRDVLGNLFVYTVTSNNGDEDKMIRLAEYLLDIGANIDYNLYEKTPLILAMDDPADGKVRSKIVKFLIDNGAKIDGNTRSGWSPILHACETNDLSIVEKMVENGAKLTDVDDDKYYNTLILSLNKECSIDLVKYLVDGGADINFKSTEDNETPLMRACENCSAEIVQYLIDKGADIHAQDIYGLTALAYAIKAGNEEVVGLLKKIIRG